MFYTPISHPLTALTDFSPPGDNEPMINMKPMNHLRTYEVEVLHLLGVNEVLFG